MKRLLVLFLGLVACGDHFSTQEAYAACDDHRQRSPANHSDASFADCVDCYERCGAECAPQGTAPEDYACPEDLGED